MKRWLLVAGSLYAALSVVGCESDVGAVAADRFCRCDLGPIRDLIPPPTPQNPTLELDECISQVGPILEQQFTESCLLCLATLDCGQISTGSFGDCELDCIGG